MNNTAPDMFADEVLLNLGVAKNNTALKSDAKEPPVEQFLNSYKLVFVSFSRRF